MDWLELSDNEMMNWYYKVDKVRDHTLDIVVPDSLDIRKGVKKALSEIFKYHKNKVCITLQIRGLVICFCRVSNPHRQYFDVLVTKRFKEYNLLSKLTRVGGVSTKHWDDIVLFTKQMRSFLGKLVLWLS